MSQQELLIRVAGVLDRLGVNYMVTGSFASSAQGAPRSTHDVDLVVALDASAVPDLVRAFPPPDFYLSEDAVREGVRSRSSFNLLAVHEGDKVDFWLLTDEPFDRSRFARRQLVDFEGVQVQVSAPEDTILAKLRWAQLSGGSEKQFTDALRVYELQRGALDRNYLETWAKNLGVEALWGQLRAAAGDP